jgi:hypothetical protein
MTKADYKKMTKAEMAKALEEDIAEVKAKC